MDTKLIAALACASALALGACSGGNPPVPADTAPDPDSGTTDLDPDDPGTTDQDPADPPADDRTEAKRFDDDLEEAEADLAAARSMVTAAAATSAGIAAARKALTDALAAARALQAPPDDSGRTARAARLALKADAAEAEDLPRLRAAESSAGAGWSASSLVIGREILGTPEIPAVRTQRETEAGQLDDTRAIDADTLLTEEEIPAVMYEDGKVVMSPGLRSSRDRLLMRGIPVLFGSRPQNGAELSPRDTRLFLYVGFINSNPRSLVDPTDGGNDGVELDNIKLVAGLRITPGGLVVDMGGKGAPGLDFRLPQVFLGQGLSGGTILDSGTKGGYDLKLTFGPPRASPEGNAEHYWTARLMPDSDHLENPTINAALSAAGREELGTYIMRLSNHAGLDRNLEDPDDPAASARDDVNHYLSYAAYGHMEFSDNFVTATNWAGIVPGQRTFPFHVGYDAFKDEDGMRATDVAEKIRGTFRGRTLASQFAFIRYAHSGLGFYPGLRGANSLTQRDANYLRLRGDVRLTATISGTAADNKISGTITNLESFDNREEEWEDYARITGPLTLQAGDIEASGEFAGVVDTAALTEFTEGGYRGNFYGPVAGLEAAGIWYLQDAIAADTPAQNLSIVGSFGAALVRDDGTYGVVVRPVGD